MTRKESDTYMSWCLKNNIIIDVEPVNNNEVIIVIKFRNKPPILGEIYYPSKKIKQKDLKWWEEVRKLYKAYYDKYSKII